jgi:5-methyltetrahydrofolate--homocysteine methyltransferase
MMLDKSILILDGAMGTMLQKYGLEGGGCNEEWNLSRPEIVSDIHRQYIEAGADIILTNTFGANSIKLKNFGLKIRAEEINVRAVSLAKDAVDKGKIDRKVFIAGNIGPSGEMLTPLGTLTKQDLCSSFKAQAEALKKGGVDLIIIETMTGIEEAEIALNAAKETLLPVIVSMSFNMDSSGDNFHTMMGVDIEKFVDVIGRKADGLGINCGGIAFEMDEVIRRLRKLTKLPLMAEPNAGKPKLINGKTFYDLSLEKMAEIAVKLKNAGANIIGGCCGTTPGHITAIARAIKGTE